MTPRAIAENSLLFVAILVVTNLTFGLDTSIAEESHHSRRLMICGGGAIPDEIIASFVSLAGANDGKLVVIPTASHDNSLPKGDRVIQSWKARGIENVTMLHTRNRDQANRQEFIAPIRKATAVWFSGGSQSRIAEAYVGTAVERELHSLLDRGGIIGGTSAGAAIQSRVMIRSGKNKPSIGTGFDLLPGTIIDQHFLARNRINRSLAAVRKHPDRIGIGIDEGTAILVQDEQIEVLGNSHVLVITAPKVAEPLKVRSFARGAKFRLTDFAKQEKELKWAIILHGGAGSPPKDADEALIASYKDQMTDALLAGTKLLKNGGTSLAAVEAVIRNLEDDPLFNAGRGAVFNHDGEHELDASIMDGRTLACGGVAGVRTVKNPISLARLVMTKTKHVLLGGAGADRFAAEMKVEQVKQNYFSTDRRRKQLHKAIEREESKAGATLHLENKWKYGTVGCVALDSKGDIAAGTSTGGRTNKKHGRIGDSPIISAGTYANNKTCGVSASGIGEEFIRNAATFQISVLMEHGGMTLAEAAHLVLHKKLRKGDGGIIAIDRNGQIVSEFTTPVMFRAAANSEGLLQVKIREK